MFTVPSDYNFHDPACKGVDFICWPTVAASSIEFYASKGKGIPGWDNVLLVTTLKRGSLYVVPLSADRQTAAGHMSRYFQSENRYRDTAVSPDGKTIYVATDPGGMAEALAGGTTRTMQNPGAILAFTYVGEGSGAPVGEPQRISGASPTNSVGTKAAPGAPPRFTAAQAAAGKTSYDANCAVCHGNTMTNGTFGPPLAGEAFKGVWSGRTVRAFYDKSKAMPPASPASLPDATYANIVAYVFQVNGVKAGKAKLPAGGDALDKMTIR
jgi:mono/diheme cytochrome c family protein